MYPFKIEITIFLQAPETVRFATSLTLHPQQPSQQTAVEGSSQKTTRRDSVAGSSRKTSSVEGS